MGIASKEKLKVARTEAVERLRALAGQLEHGLVHLGDIELRVPEEVRLEIKADSDELEIDVKW